MFLRWSEVLIRRAGLVLVLGVLATILAGFYGMGVFDKLGQGGFDDPNTEAAKELAHEQDVFGNKSADVIAIYRSKDLERHRPRLQGRGRGDGRRDPGRHHDLGGHLLGHRRPVDGEHRQARHHGDDLAGR